MAVCDAGARPRIDRERSCGTPIARTVTLRLQDAGQSLAKIEFPSN
jgi:hypothetical protein